MITEYVRYLLPEDAIDAFLTAYRTAAASLEASEECLRFDLSRCVEEPRRFTLRIEWTSMEGHMSGFRKGPHFAAFLSAVRPYIENIEEMQHYEATDVRSRGSLYDAVGGGSALFRLARAMHHEMKVDATLSSVFGNAAESHVPHLGMWLCEVFGGPALYSAALGDIALILKRHSGLNISEAQRAAFVACAQRAADSALSDAPSDAREAIMRYVEWGTHIAVENSLPDHVADAAAGVPTWDWDTQG